MQPRNEKFFPFLSKARTSSRAPPFSRRSRASSAGRSSPILPDGEELPLFRLRYAGLRQPLRPHSGVLHASYFARENVLPKIDVGKAGSIAARLRRHDAEPTMARAAWTSDELPEMPTKWVLIVNSSGLSRCGSCRVGGVLGRRRRDAGSSKRCWPRSGSPGEPTRPALVGGPTLDSPRLGAGPVPGFRGGRAAGRVVRVGRSNVGRSVADASATALLG
jgi:hypothetical protein